MTSFDPHHLMPIGRFSELSRLSVKALRHYDETGLLSPSWVDPDSGYRYYRRDQTNRAEGIRLLRSVDMPLDQIREVLDASDPELRRTLLQEHRRLLEDRLATQQRMLDSLEHVIDRNRVVPYDVSVVASEPMRVLALEAQVDLAGMTASIAEGFRRLFAHASRHGAVVGGRPLIVFHDIVDELQSGTIEMCLPVDRDLPDHEPLRCRLLPGGRTATTTHRGPYVELAAGYHALAGWMLARGEEPAGPPREIYVSDPATVETSELVTEIAWPITGTAP